MENKEDIHTDLVIIGTGMAGMAAAVFAANRGLSGVVVGGAGAFEYASGLLDLWGLTSPETGLCKDPWQGIARIPKYFPSHPFLKIAESDIQAAFDELTQGLTQSGLVYGGLPRENSAIMTAFGTAKPTYRFPLTMANNVTALAEKKPLLLLDFQGLREFRAKFVQQVLKSTWEEINIGAVDFPQMSRRSELFTPLMAQAMEAEQVQDKLLAAIKPLIRDEHFLGMPAILGINRSENILNRLEDGLGIKIFEIPTSPISVPGIRLKETFKKMLANTSVTQMPDQRVLLASHSPGQGFVLETGTPSSTHTTRIQAKTCILATGRFLAKGLAGDRNGVTETVFNLPVAQPMSRENWHGTTYFDPRGHAINLAGLSTDENFRPLGRGNTPVHGNLYAAGSILAGQDWMRNRSGSGISIASAFQAMGHITSNQSKTSA
ncbi:MAG: anaerobic glycerol-3-phosphate dehydrogenase subunit B [Deltaproteobacteria bacterium]|nr:MAG: anaerobic glycerol-3-phosphate dehydrogenase subunit B [Deltaproteobacteria bacterium]